MIILTSDHKYRYNVLMILLMFTLKINPIKYESLFIYSAYVHS